MRTWLRVSVTRTLEGEGGGKRENGAKISPVFHLVEPDFWKLEEGKREEGNRVEWRRRKWGGSKGKRGEA